MYSRDTGRGNSRGGGGELRSQNARGALRCERALRWPRGGLAVLKRAREWPCIRWEGAQPHLSSASAANEILTARRRGRRPPPGDSSLSAGASLGSGASLTDGRATAPLAAGARVSGASAPEAGP